nr:Dihydrofolate reductase [uncultured bacterium]
MRPRISLVVAHSRNRVIGREGQLPWRLSGDLKRFKQLTMGHHLLMGRKTLESIGRILPGRTSLVLTRQPEYVPPAGCEAAIRVPDFATAVKLAADAGDEEVFVIGGGEVYRLALPFADRIHLTLVEAQIEGDTTFPALDAREWMLNSEERHPADARNEYPFAVQLWERTIPS